MTRLLFAVLLLCLTLGCARKTGSESVVGAPRTTQVSAAKEGWTEVSTAGVRVSFPNNWQPLDLTRQDVIELTRQAHRDNPNAEQLVKVVQEAVQQGYLKLIVFNMDTLEGDFAQNANLAVTRVPADATLDLALRESAKEMQSMLAPGTRQVSEKVSLPAGEFGRIVSIIQQGQGRYVADAYLIPTAGQLYVFTFSAEEAERVEIAKIARECMETVRFE
jgi:hypothetical protein